MKTGVFLINLGTPNSPSVSDVRRYLTQFLNDPRVIDINPIGRFFLVNGIIVPFRASKSAKLYKEIWTQEGSPLLSNSIKLRASLQEALGEKNYKVVLGMRYQNPNFESALEELRQSNVEKIIAIPLYPQYASSSTGSSVQHLFDHLRNWEVTPSVEVISKFYDREDFINACVDVASNKRIKDYDHVLFSYHGLPERHIKKATEHYGCGKCVMGTCCNTINEYNQYCYRASCYETTRSLVDKLNIQEGKYTTSFQSRLNDKWIKPYSDKVVENLAKEGAKKLLVFSPSFTADCLETIYEISVEYQEIFEKYGGEKIELVESLNSHPSWVSCLSNIVHENA